MKQDKFKKVLMIGSGPIKIAEAAEFDYSGSQALKALREEGIETILVNSNVATVQTSYKMADKVYLLPVAYEFVQKVIEKERPDGIMLGFGGQTALNVGIDLFNNGVLEKYGTKVMGTEISGIERALSRQIFKESMLKCGIETAPSMSAGNENSALIAAKTIGFPLILRASFNLGGRGSSIVWNETQLKRELKRAFANSRISEILLERHLTGWKEIEYEVVRDKYGTCAVVACIENLDPMGVHTGESSVVTPAQTLDNYEYQQMRSVAIRVAEAIGLVGECNVQFALDPVSYKFYVIETNPRMSRSSALASKATGYPLAYVSAKLALGHRLYEVKNSVSKVTTACFEPSLDYITVKIPRWDLQKFEEVENKTTSEMKSIGEVMGIGRNFEEAFQKAIRMLDIKEPGLVGGPVYNSKMTNPQLKEALDSRQPYWFVYAAKAFKEGFSVGEVFDLTLVDRFFLEKIKALVDRYESEKKTGFKNYAEMKALGFSDEQLGGEQKAEMHIKQIDTLAGEWPAKANYLYTTYNSVEDDVPRSKGKKLLVLGAGVFRIGVSVEFDWSAISLANSAKKYFDEVALINYNPETVSTDWDIVDRLYFDEISEERISSICKKDGFDTVATFAAGQLGNNISDRLEKRSIKILGTAGKSVDIAEDRGKFSKLVDSLGMKQPQWINAGNMEEARKFATEVGFPILVRPSYVLSGSAMNIAHNMAQLEGFIHASRAMSPTHPIVISKFINGIEAELDCASDSSNVIGISTVHVEEAGVHSGDATVATPFIDAGYRGKMHEIAVKLANNLSIKGPFNIQFILGGGNAYIIELNMRASRSMPFTSKSVGIDLIEYAARGIFDKFDWNGFYEPEHKSTAVKSAQFSWTQLKKSYPFLGPEMRSTGEGAALGRDFDDALAKSWLGILPNRIPQRSVLVYGRSNVGKLGNCADNFSKRLDTYTLAEAEAGKVNAITQEKALELLEEKKIDLVITDGSDKDFDYRIRRTTVDMNLPIVLNGALGEALSKALFSKNISYGELKDYW